MAADVMDDNTQMDYKIKISGKAPLKERKGRFNAPIYKILSITGNKLALYGLAEPVHDQPELTSKDVLRETSYDVQALRAYMAANMPRLTPD
ncbi:hypothetical protein TNIN_274991 [Trichonephila inaurata madagascariensis]|uniref:Uncharacterized protein n=1 Tax=Trichonephila inaurata madagascariensis TaxID=2747483 RepID=A0A8X7BSY5_9ARAC|nr:hypothetical protein TNIN_274991 [Trichonephila inaurata madagascariensis]